MNHTITIAKLKYYPEMSEETYCFRADVLLDGKKVGTAENRGTGGETVIHVNADIIPMADRSEVADIVDEFVHAEVIDRLKKRDMKAVERKLSKNMVFRTKGQEAGKYYEIRGDAKDENFRKRVFESSKSKGKEIDIIINDLPIHEAIKYFYRYE